MISLYDLLQDPNKYKLEMKKRFIDDGIIDQIVELENDYKPAQSKLELLRKEKNEFNKIVVSLSGQEKVDKIAEMKTVSSQIKDLEKKVKDLKESQSEYLFKVPNLTWESIPVGKDDSANVVTGYINKKEEYSFKPVPYYELSVFKRDYKSQKGIKASGYRGYYISGEVAKLQKALFEYVMDRLIQKGFEYVIPPTMVMENVMYGTGFFPADKSETYQFDNHGKQMYLTGTSEPSLMFMVSDEVFDLTLNPVKLTAQTRCYRAEAGKHGADTKGGMRVHEFEKIETVFISNPDSSSKTFEEMTSIFQSLLLELGIYGHNLEVSSGDISLKNHRQIDIEGYFPGQGKFMELCSSSNCTDYQTRNLNIKVINKEGEKVLAHSQNCTGITNRTLWCILEQFQNEDGSVTIPKALIPKFGKNILS